MWVLLAYATTSWFDASKIGTYLLNSDPHLKAAYFKVIVTFLADDPQHSLLVQKEERSQWTLPNRKLILGGSIRTRHLHQVKYLTKQISIYPWSLSQLYILVWKTSGKVREKLINYGYFRQSQSVFHTVDGDIGWKYWSSGVQIFILFPRCLTLMNLKQLLTESFIHHLI